MTATAEKILLYVQTDGYGKLLLVTTNPNDLMPNLPTTPQFVWVEKP